METEQEINSQIEEKKQSIRKLARISFWIYLLGMAICALISILVPSQNEYIRYIPMLIIAFTTFFLSGKVFLTMIFRPKTFSTGALLYALFTAFWAFYGIFYLTILPLIHFYQKTNC